MKKSIIVTTILVIVAGVTFFLLSRHDHNHSKPALTGEYLSDEEYKLALEEFTTFVRDTDPKQALIAMEQRAKNDDKFANVCHGIAHSIGHEAYEKYQDFGIAMQYAEVACNVGYIHGVAESHFKSVSDVKNEVKTVCSNYDPNTFVGMECRHGVGHGLMWATDNNVPDALQYCDMYEDEDSKYACHTGVFMENFHTNAIFHPSEFLDLEDPFSLCESMALQYKNACTRYAVHYFIRANGNDFSAGLIKCESVKYFLRDACSLGVGDLAIKENINNPKVVEQLCNSASTIGMKEACIRGMSSLYVNQFGSLELGKEMCETLEPNNNKVCNSVMDDIPDGYYQ